MISLIVCHGGGKLGQMPSQGQDIQWIPVDIAASSIVEIALQNYIKNDDIHSGRAKDLRLGGCKQFLGECKEIFALKFRKKSVKRTKKFFFRWEKMIIFDYWGGVHPPTPPHFRGP